MDYREGYINIDFSDVGSDGKPIKVDLKCDILELPYDYDSVDEIIFHESLEHFNRWNGLSVIKSIWMILKPGGKLSLTVPNAERQLKILLTRMNDDVSMDDFLHAHEKFTFWKWHDDLMGATHESDGMDGDSHKTLYSKKSIKWLMDHFGFKIQKFSVDSSIRVEAVK